MKQTPEQTDSLKKALDASNTFDEAKYYRSQQVELGGEDVMDEGNEPEEEEEEEEFEDHEFYGDD